MPGYDGTGPQGRGSMTGGRRGYCAPGTPGRAVGTGYGPGRGRGYGAGYGPGQDYGPGYGPGRGAGRGGFGRGRGFGPGWGAGYGPGSGPGWGAGYGPGTGFAGWLQRGWGCLWPAAAPAMAYSPQDEKAYLQEEADALRRELGEIERRLDSVRDGDDRQGSDREGPDEER